jgi:hypothetical protein
VPFGARKTAGEALEVGENPLAALVLQLRQRIREKSLIIHA